MSIKLFISYTHKDDSYRKELQIHLSSLRRNSYIRDWSDREIIPSNDWKGEIDDNLKNSDVILFLVSPDFIASDYCYDVEVKKALEMHEKNEAKVIPIILRHCDWKDTPFAKLSALPLDAKPVYKWEDKDEAWLDIVEGIKKIIVDIKRERAEKKIIKKMYLNKEFQNWLIDTEVSYSHSRKAKLFLEDIYIAPDLQKLCDFDKITTTVCDVEAIIKPGFKIIFGDEQSGKTTLAKQYFKYLFQRGDLPILLAADEVKKSDIDKIARKAFLRQYQNSDLESYEKAINRIIIIDDYSEIRLNRKYQNKLVDNMKRLFGTIVLLASDSFEYIVSEISALDEFERYEIKPFGNIKRAELIKKWVSLGIEEEIDEEELYNKVDAIKLHIDSFVRRNIVPSKPVYLITLMQTFEHIIPQRVNLTSYGHCYQYLIYRALEKSKIKNNEIDSYLNFLTEFANTMFHNEGRGLDEPEIDDFFKRYHEKYLKIDKEKVINNLIRSSILHYKDDKILFKYRYIYYFYVAKSLAENLVIGESGKKIICDLLKYLHKEDCANIIIFITHHTKDKWILDQIQNCLIDLFTENEEASLEVSELGFMEDFFKKIPSLVIEQKEIEEVRKKSNQQKDRDEKLEKEINEKIEKLDPEDLRSKLNRTFKGIEIIGQIVRNRYGSLDKKTLTIIVEQAYCVGLRCLRYFLELSDILKDEMIRMFKNALREKSKMNTEELEKCAENIFFLLVYYSIYGLLRRIAFPLGCKEAEEIYERIEIKFETPAVKLINQSIELQFQKRINHKQLKKLSEEFKKNIVCDRILKEIVIQHLYMHHVEYKDKQKISQTFHIPISHQRQLEAKSNLKI